MKVSELIEELNKVSDKNVEVYTNHHVNTDEGHAYHKQASKVVEVIRNKKDVVLDSDFVLINASSKK